MTQDRRPGNVIWPVDSSSLKHFGAEDLVITNETISTWCQAYFYGGNTLRIWNEAVELKMALLAACSLQEGQRVFLVAKYGNESGIEPAVSSLIGQKGQLTLEEIGPRAVTAFQKVHSEPGTPLQWDFNYFDSLPDESVDRIILFGAAAHVRNWADFAQQIHRVLLAGGRVISADAPWGGKELLHAAHLDIHTEGILDKLLSGMGLKEEDLPTTGPEELTEAFQPFLSWSQSFSWRGLYLFYGQKDGQLENPAFSFPVSTDAVQTFLTEKPSTGPWDFLAAAEIDILGEDLVDVNKQKHWGRVIGWGGDLGGVRSGAVVKPMWSNLKAKPGDKALVIGEGLERVYLPELRKRIGDSGEIAAFDINPKHRVTMETLWKYGPDTYIPERHQWDYPFADDYPDEYFDLVWLPQGVHHARDWKDIAPRLVRALKPQGQVMMIENRTGNPEFFDALRMSCFLNYMAEKIFWGWNLTLEELPDYPTKVLEEVFSDLLTDIYGLEWKGWLLFWGYKK